MFRKARSIVFTAVVFIAACGVSLGADGSKSEPNEVLRGLRDFYHRTARADGSFSPGVDPDYLGMSDCAYSDLAAVTYACTIHKTLGWRLPHEKKTVEFLRSRQREDGAFFNVAGTVDPDSAEGRTYNTTQALVALHALGAGPKYDPLPVFEDILKEDYKSLPAYSTSFFPLAYLCYGKPIPEKADRGIRALMIQDETGYLNDHIAATFHASHYYRLVGEPTPKAEEMVARTLRDQKPDGSWLRNMPSRDRHATFDAVFVLRQEGLARADCQAAIERAAHWALSCRNSDGGFGHYPGSTSDADAVYFQVGTLVMAGFLKPAEPLPTDPHLLSWGHLMPTRDSAATDEIASFRCGGWVSSVVFSPDGTSLAAGAADGIIRLWNLETAKEEAALRGHEDGVASLAFSPNGRVLASGGYDHTASLCDAATGKLQHTLQGHRGVVASIAFHPHAETMATGSLDGTVKLWSSSTGELAATLTGHKSWVNALAFVPDGKLLASGSSDGTIILWSLDSRTPTKTLHATKAEVRSLAVSPDGARLAAGIRYGAVKIWDTSTWTERLDFQGHESDVWTVAFSPDGRTLATGNGDWNRGGQIKFWDVRDGSLQRTLQHTGEVLCLAFSPEGQHIAAGAGDKTVRVWKTNPRGKISGQK
jgi:geranylgeranyl transferase type-2 subunit beta